MACRAAADLEIARASGANIRAVRVASQTLTDAVNQLRQVLISREKMEQSQSATYSAREIAFVLNQILCGVRSTLETATPRLIARHLKDKNLIDASNAAVVEHAINRYIRDGVFLTLSENFAEVALQLADCTHKSTIAERRDLHLATLRAWRGTDSLQEQDIV
jgi:hypothetical protein